MIIGIAGGSCTGKTTLLKELETRLGDDFASILFDDYFIGTENIKEEVTDWESPSLYRYNSFVDDLKVLKKGKPIKIVTKSRESTDLGIRMKLVRPKKYTVIEGFLIYWDVAARELFDKRIFITLPEDEIIRRRLARSKGTSRWDAPDYINNKLIPGHRKYVEPQKEFSHLTIDGRKTIHQITNEVVSFLNQP